MKIQNVHRQFHIRSESRRKFNPNTPTESIFIFYTVIVHFYRTTATGTRRGSISQGIHGRKQTDTFPIQIHRTYTNIVSEANDTVD